MEAGKNKLRGGLKLPYTDSPTVATRTGEQNTSRGVRVRV